RNLNLSADGDSRWIDFFSDGFAQINAPLHSSTVPADDGFFLWETFLGLSGPPAGTFTPIGVGFDLFPNEGSWLNFAQITYADGIVNGTTAITGLTGVDNGLATNIIDTSTPLGANFVGPISRTATLVSGSVDIVGGEVTNVNLLADIEIIYDFGAGSFFPRYQGTFEIINNAFTVDIAGNPTDLAIMDSFLPPLFQGRDIDLIWDLQGSAAAVPLPAAAWLMAPCLMMLLRRRGA
ncbi:MAG: hypothetical protein AAF384_19650, partial [Pseudomonadota bacterium]